MKREKLMAVVPLALFGLLILVLIIGLHHANKGDVSKFAMHVGDPVPVSDLPILNGSDARFATNVWRGRPYLVNFFASWCPDCKAEHEELMTLAASNMPMIGVVFKDKADRVNGFLDRAGNPYVAVAQDDDGRAAIDWGLTGVPETFLIDEYGIIRWHYIGALTDAVVSDELMPIWVRVKDGG
jgi:cytochrome c biogenesis protein CcmG/thiol:disulfide interchange protein DsbE